MPALPGNDGFFVAAGNLAETPSANHFNSHFGIVEIDAANQANRADFSCGNDQIGSPVDKASVFGAVLAIVRPILVVLDATISTKVAMGKI